jgi:pre-mRNA-splicing factor CWC26
VKREALEDQERPSRRRYDSSDDDDEKEDTKPRTKRQQDSEDDDGKDRRPRRRYDSSDNDDSSGRKKRMTSGHKAGLQHYKDFNKSEGKIQKQKKQDAQLMVDKYGMGETVYRDKDGRKGSEQPQQQQQQQQNKQGQPELKPLNPAESRRLNTGKVQRDAQQANAQELRNLQESTFARHKDDGQLEEMRKREIRKDDPMAAYEAKSRATKSKKKKSSKKSNNNEEEQPEDKPIYKGPPPKANRYGIRPGYRWDGVDRGNGWEDKLLAKQFSSTRKKEEAYRWRSADM